jgi:hypothetical protein
MLKWHVSQYESFSKGFATVLHKWTDENIGLVRKYVGLYYGLEISEKFESRLTTFMGPKDGRYAALWRMARGMRQLEESFRPLWDNKKTPWALHPKRWLVQALRKIHETLQEIYQDVVFFNDTIWPYKAPEVRDIPPLILSPFPTNPMQCVVEELANRILGPFRDEVDIPLPEELKYPWDKPGSERFHFRLEHRHVVYDSPPPSVHPLKMAAQVYRDYLKQRPLLLYPCDGVYNHDDTHTTVEFKPDFHLGQPSAELRVKSIHVNEYFDNAPDVIQAAIHFLELLVHADECPKPKGEEEEAVKRTKLTAE